MYCSNCKHTFCWICMGTSCGHSGCKKQAELMKTDDNFKKAEQDREKAKNSLPELARYQFYFERFYNHQNSIKICIKQKDKLKEKCRLLHEVKKYPSKDLEFFEECADQVIQCRQVLKYTYVVGYFADICLIKKDIELFKFQQQMLEESCELTHNKMEEDMDPYLDIDKPDRNPFFKYKDGLLGRMHSLQKQYHHFTEAISLSDKFIMM